VITAQLDIWAETPSPVELSPVPRTAKKPRYYQVECLEAIRVSLFGSEDSEPHRSCLVVMATGLGKTVIFSQAAADIVSWLPSSIGRVLVIAHRDELITQAREALREATGEYVGTEKAEHSCSLSDRIVVSSIQTMHRRLDKFQPDHFALIVIDEAHRAAAESYLKTTRYFAGKVLGVTATPDRADEKGLSVAFDDVAYVMDIEDGIDAGYLVSVEGVDVALDDIDLSNVDMAGADLNQEQLDDAMVKAVEGVVTKTFELAGDRQTIVFTPGVKSAHAMCDRMNLLAPGKAIAIDGETDWMLRKSLVSGYKAGRYQYLFNCDIATEGFDAPATSVIVNGAPTRSRGKFAQRAGRGTRVLPGIVDDIEGKDGAAARRFAIAMSDKPSMLILNFVEREEHITLIGPADILGANYSDEEVETAKKALKAKPDGDIQTALKEARNEHKRLAAALAAAKVKVTARAESFDPFKSLGMDRQDAIDIRYGQRPLTDVQASELIRRGLPVKDVEALSFRQAGKLIKKARERQKAGLATLKQLNTLNKYLPVNDTVSFDLASKAITYISTDCNWKTARVDRGRLAQILTAEAAQ